MKLKTNIARFLAVIALIGMTGAAILPLEAGAVTTQPKVQAFYQDSLATKLTSAGTSMTLVRGTDTQGRVLSGYYGFVIDEGTASQETILGTASGTAVTSLIRGVDVVTATSSVSSNIQDHSRGASVKITTWPSLGIINNQLSGNEGIPAPIYYQNLATTTIGTNRNNLASVGLVQDIAFNGASVINAATTNKGVVQIATNGQAASSTLNGSTGAQLVLPSAIASSTYNAGSSFIIPVTGANNKLDVNFIATSSLGFPVLNYQEFTSSGTWTKPSNLTGNEVVIAQLWAAGGAGGGSDNATARGAGGGGGSFLEIHVKASDLAATTSVTIGAGGIGVSGANGNPGGNTTFASSTTFGGGGGGGGGGAGANDGGGGGGGLFAAGTSANITANGVGGAPLGGATSTDSAFGGGGGNSGRSVYGGAGGGQGASTGVAGGQSVYGGAGGGGGGSTPGAAGTSVGGGFGGAGSSTTTGNPGIAPGGGGGGVTGGTGTGGAGARGLVRVWVITS